MVTELINLQDEICISHSHNYEDYCVLGCKAKQSGRNVLLFQRILLPPSSSTLITKTAGSCTIKVQEEGGSILILCTGTLLTVDDAVPHPKRQHS